MKNLIKVPSSINYIETSIDKDSIKFSFATEIKRINIFIKKNSRDIKIFENSKQIIGRDIPFYLNSKRLPSEKEFNKSVKNYFSLLKEEFPEIYNKIKTTLKEEKFSFYFKI